MMPLVLPDGCSLYSLGLMDPLSLLYSHRIPREPQTKFLALSEEGLIGLTVGDAAGPAEGGGGRTT